MIYFTADLHLGHSRIIEDPDFSDRGKIFRNIEIHDDYILARIDDYVKPEDTLYILGDVAFTTVACSRIKGLQCKNIYLIWGNHDRAGYAKFFKGCVDVEILKLKIQCTIPLNQYQDQKDIKVFLSHYPHAYWPSSHHGALHLYGHCHGKRELTLDQLFPERRSIDVGLDNTFKILEDYRPLSEQQVLDLFALRKGHDEISFYSGDQNG